MSISEDARNTREGSVGWIIQRLAKRLNDGMDKRLSTLGLTVTQFAVMMTVLETEGLTQTEIGKRFELPAYMITRVLNVLEERGFVVRKVHPTSRRAFNIYASEAGKKLGPELFSIVNAVNDDFILPLNETDRAEFRRIIMQLLVGGSN